MKKLIFSICLVLVASHSFADEWRLQPGRANDIAIGSNGKVWIVTNTPTGGGFTIQEWNGTEWSNVDGGAVRIAVDPIGNPWVINNANQIFKRENGRWVLMPGTATDISIGANGAVWIIGTGTTGGGNTIHFWNGTGWTLVGGGGTRIAVAPNGQPFVINNGKTIFERTTAGAWITKSGAGTDIGIGANGKIWVIGYSTGATDFDVFQWMGTDWSGVDGGGTVIAVDNQGYPWLINSSHEIYRRVFTPPSYRITPLTEPVSMSYYNTGRLAAVAINPSNNNHIIVAGETGGLFETTNAGAADRRWRHLTEFNHYSVSDVLIVILPSGSHEVWVTTNSSFEKTDNPQIWKRSVFGVWARAQTVRTTYVPFIYSKALRIIKAKTSNILFACGTFGFAVKPEDTDVWTIKSTASVGNIIAIESMENGNIVAATSAGVYFSNNQGDTWTRASASGFSLPTFNDPIAQRFILKADPLGKVIFTSSLTASLTQLYASTDNGVSWTRAASTFGRPYGGAGGFESVQPYYNTLTRQLELYISNRVNIYYGFSTGANLTEAVANLFSAGILTDYLDGWGFNAGHEDTRQAFILNQGLSAPKMIITSDGGFSSAAVTSTQRPETYAWTIDGTNSGLNALQVYNFTGTDKGFYFGTQDDGYGYNNNGLLNTWEPGGGREGFMVKKNGNGFYDNITLKGHATSLGKVINTGPSPGWFPVTDCSLPGTTDIWNAPVGDFSRPINYCKDVYIQDSLSSTSGNHVWKITYDKGCSWKTLAFGYFPSSAEHKNSGKAFFSCNDNMNPSLTATFLKDGKIVTGCLDNILTRKPSDGYWYYATMTNHRGIAVRRNEFLASPLFSVNSKNRNNLISVEERTGLLKNSTTTGNTWTEITSFTNTYTERGRYSLISDNGLYAIWNVEFSPFDPTVIVVGTVERGLFVSKDAGVSWVRINSEGIFMPTDFHWRSATEVIVTTYGAGLFKLLL